MKTKASVVAPGAVGGPLASSPALPSSPSFSTSAVAVHDLTVAYREKPVLWDVDLEVPPGVLMAVVGPNGAGKTTLIKSVLGLVKPVSGEVLVQGKPYSPRAQAVAYVPQRGTVDWDFPTTVFDVALMGTYGRLGWFRRPGAAERARAAEALARVGMGAFAERQISQLSGGQQQRVFLARALVQDAPVYLMDEPFQGVDAVTERAIVDILRELRTRGRTVVVSSHLLDEVVSPAAPCQPHKVRGRERGAETAATHQCADDPRERGLGQRALPTQEVAPTGQQLAELFADLWHRGKDATALAEQFDPEEWTEIIKRIWSEEKPFDYKGKFFDLKGVIGKPKPWGGGRPMLMSAGSSPAGRAFASKHVDCIFMPIGLEEKVAGDVAALAAAEPLPLAKVS